MEVLNSNGKYWLVVKNFVHFVVYGYYVYATFSQTPFRLRNFDKESFHITNVLIFSYVNEYVDIY